MEQEIVDGGYGRVHIGLHCTNGIENYCVLISFTDEVAINTGTQT